MTEKQKIGLAVLITAAVISSLFALAIKFNWYCKITKGILINDKCYKLPKEFYDPYSSLIIYYYIQNGKYYQTSRLNTDDVVEITEAQYIFKFKSVTEKTYERQYQ